MRLLVVFVLVLHATPGSSNSSGMGGACFADVLTLCTLNCPDDTARPWANKSNAGVLSPCCPPGMDLVVPPTHSPAYSLTAPSSKYTPGSIVTVSLDVLKKDAKYLGLLLYAVQDNGREIRVGTWSFPAADNQKFWTPPNCGKQAVMHKNAGVKHIHHTFDFAAPPAGTGPIRFRALIKHGETNGGSFFWPKVDLILNEGPTQASPVWIRGSFGQSCAAACTGEGLSCDAVAIQSAMSLSGKAQFDSASKFTPCLRPHISNNGNSCDSHNMSLLSTADGFCFYRDDKLCPPVEDVCGATTSDTRRRSCACVRPTTTKSPIAASTVTSTTDGIHNPVSSAANPVTPTTGGIQKPVDSATNPNPDPKPVSGTTTLQIANTAIHQLLCSSVAVLTACVCIG